MYIKTFSGVYKGFETFLPSLYKYEALRDLVQFVQFKKR